MTSYKLSISFRIDRNGHLLTRIHRDRPVNDHRSAHEQSHGGIRIAKRGRDEEFTICRVGDDERSNEMFLSLFPRGFSNATRNAL